MTIALQNLNSIDTLLTRIRIDVKLAVEVDIVSKNDLLKIDLQQNEKENMSGQLQLKIQQVWNSLVEAEEQIILVESAVKQSTENLKMNRDYYNAGTSSISDLLDAQTIYRQSYNRLTNAYIDYKLTLSEYLFATARGV